MLARLHDAPDPALSALGIRVAADASANRASNVLRTSASRLSNAGAVWARMGLKAANKAIDDRKNMLIVCCVVNVVIKE
jgi:hypothetical protein